MIKDTISLLKLSPKFMVPITIVLGIVLFGPSGLTENLGLNEFKEAYRMYMGVAFLLALGLCLSAGFIFLQEIVKRSIAQRRETKRQLKILSALSADEKQLLIALIYEGKRSAMLSFFDPDVKSLEALGILVRTGTLAASHDVRFPYAIQTWAWDHLNADRKLLRVN